jgi:hypothetical protein
MPEIFDEIDRDLLLRQSRLLYPEIEDWILNMSIEAYISSEERAPKGLKSLAREEEAEAEEEALKGAFEPRGRQTETVIINKQCDDEVCISCGS